MRACLKSLNEKNNARRKTEAIECPRHLERMQRNSAAAHHLELGCSSTAQSSAFPRTGGNKISFNGGLLRDPLNEKIAEQMLSNYESLVGTQPLQSQSRGSSLKSMEDH